MQNLRHLLQEKKYFYSIIIISIFIVVLTTYCIGELYNVAILNDEFGYWSTASYYTGYDWNELIEHTPYYNI